MESDRIRSNTVTHELDVDIEISDSEHCEQSRVSLPPVSAKKYPNKVRLISLVVCLALSLIGLGIVSGFLIDAQKQISNLKSEGASRQAFEAQIEELQKDLKAKQEGWNRKEESFVAELATLQSKSDLEQKTSSSKEALEEKWNRKEEDFVKRIAKLESDLNSEHNIRSQMTNTNQAFAASLESALQKNRDLEIKKSEIEKQMASQVKRLQDDLENEKAGWKTKEKRSQEELRSYSTCFSFFDIHNLLLEVLNKGKSPVREIYLRATSVVKFLLEKYGHYFWIQEFDYAVRRVNPRRTDFRTFMASNGYVTPFGGMVSGYFENQEENFLALLYENKSLIDKPALNLAKFSEIVDQQCSGISLEKVTYTGEELKILEATKRELVNKIKRFV